MVVYSRCVGWGWLPHPIQLSILKIAQLLIFARVCNLCDPTLVCMHKNEQIKLQTKIAIHSSSFVYLEVVCTVLVGIPNLSLVEQMRLRGTWQNERIPSKMRVDFDSRSLKFWCHKDQKLKQNPVYLQQKKEQNLATERQNQMFRFNSLWKKALLSVFSLCSLWHRSFRAWRWIICMAKQI